MDSRMSEFRLKSATEPREIRKRDRGQQRWGGHQMDHQLVHMSYDQEEIEEEEEEESEINIEELLNCDNIENCSFLKTSHKLMATVDSMISQIDDKLRFKKPSAAQNYHQGSVNSVYTQQNQLGGTSRLH